MKNLLYYFLLLYLLSYSISLKHVRIMTFNIHFGNSANNEFDILRISKVIKGSKSDIVCLQEVDNVISFRLSKFSFNYLKKSGFALLYI